MTNPLIAKYEELYGKKEEAVVEEKIELPPEWNVSGVITSSVATSNTGITAANHIPPPLPPFKTLTSYDTHSVEDSFLQIAEKVKNKEAKVVYMSMNMEHYNKSVTFEVQVYS